MKVVRNSGNQEQMQLHKKHDKNVPAPAVECKGGSIPQLPRGAPAPGPLPSWPPCLGMDF